MKRILLACFLLTATTTFVQKASAQIATAVSASDFTAQTNQLDAQIAAGNITAAQATWQTINTLMKQELGYSKSQIMSAATDADKTAAVAKNRNQAAIYKTIWPLKADLTANRTALHTQLGLFGATL